jgi:hypothetical protein
MQEFNVMASAIQHFRVNEKHGYIIYSTLFGEVFVTDMIQGKVLWSLSTVTSYIDINVDGESDIYIGLCCTRYKVSIR